MNFDLKRIKFYDLRLRCIRREMRSENKKKQFKESEMSINASIAFYLLRIQLRSFESHLHFELRRMWRKSKLET